MFFRDDKVAMLKARIEELEAENQRLREALEFYADADNWEKSHKYRDADDATVFVDNSVTVIMDDRGRHAQQALKGD